MIKVISLDDKEDDCTLQVSLDSDYSGAMIYCTDTYGQKVSLIVDARLLKQLCNEVSKSVKSRAQKTNMCGTVKEKVL